MKIHFIKRIRKAIKSYSHLIQIHYEAIKHLENIVLHDAGDRRRGVHGMCGRRCRQTGSHAGTIGGGRRLHRNGYRRRDRYGEEQPSMDGRLRGRRDPKGVDVFQSLRQRGLRGHLQRRRYGQDHRRRIGAAPHGPSDFHAEQQLRRTLPEIPDRHAGQLRSPDGRRRRQTGRVHSGQQRPERRRRLGQGHAAPIQRVDDRGGHPGQRRGGQQQPQTLRGRQQRPRTVGHRSLRCRFRHGQRPRNEVSRRP